MRPDILTKLEAELQPLITSERQVVYILVELRKLIELNDDGAQSRPSENANEPCARAARNKSPCFPGHKYTS